MDQSNVQHLNCPLLGDLTTKVQEWTEKFASLVNELGDLKTTLQANMDQLGDELLENGKNASRRTNLVFSRSVHRVSVRNLSWFIALLICVEDLSTEIQDLKKRFERMNEDHEQEVSDMKNEVHFLKAENQEITDQRHREVNDLKTLLSTKNDQLNALQTETRKHNLSESHF